MAFTSLRFTKDLNDQTQDMDAATRARLAAASNDAPPFRPGEMNSNAVKVVQQALLDLSDPNITRLLPSAVRLGPTGNYLNETRDAVVAFQKRPDVQLSADGEAGHDTLGRLDQLLTPGGFQLNFAAPGPVRDLAPGLFDRQAWEPVIQSDNGFSTFSAGDKGEIFCFSLVSRICGLVPARASAQVGDIKPLPRLRRSESRRLFSWSV